MRALIACVRKDVRLFFASWTGVAALLLPAALLLCMAAGMAGTAEARTYVAPFCVAVRDEDDTVMSRMLIDQLMRVELIETVYDAAGMADQEAFDRTGAAAVLTIPRDYFYTLYDMENTPAHVTLNAGMPREAAIFRSLAASVMQIVTANQEAGLALHTLAFGETDTAERNALYAATAETILRDALSRAAVFDAFETAADVRDSKAAYYAACVCAAVLLFIPLCVTKTVSEETRLGVLARYQAAGGGLLALLAARLCTAVALCALPAGAVLLLSGVPAGPAALLTLALTLLSGFSLFLTTSLLARNVPRAQTLGNLFLLASLVLGGALYPLQLLPGFAQALARLTIPYYTVAGLTAAAAGAGFGEAAGVLWPLALMSAVCLCGSFVVYRRRVRV